MALGGGSPAINAGSNTLALTTDQRGPGFARTVGAGTDIGAFEFGAGIVLPAAIPTPTVAPGLLGMMSALLAALGFAGLRRRRSPRS